MAELNHFRKYAIAQNEEGDPLEILRDEVRVVCLGFDTARHRFVEIGALTGGGRELFIRRAKLATSLRHSSIASVVDYGKEDDSCFYVSDFVDGEVISDYAARIKAIPPETVVSWLLELAEGCVFLDTAGLQASVASARICMTGTGTASVRIVDHGITGTDKKCHFGGELADLLEQLTNYQSAGEVPVYPPEIGGLSSTLRGIKKADEAVDAICNAGIDCKEPVILAGQRPRLLLERQLFRKIRPEHVLPERYSVLQRAGEISPYESIVEDSMSGVSLRILILPPERIIPERMLDIFEDSGCPALIGCEAFWKHQDFRLLAERVETGFSLADWLDAVPRCEAVEIAEILDGLEAMLAEIATTALNPRLHPADIFFVFVEIDEDEVTLLRNGEPVVNWPAFYLKARPHRTIRALTDIADGDVPGGAEEVFSAAERGEWLPSALIVSWYLSLRRRGLVHQAAELAVNLRDVSWQEDVRTDIHEGDEAGELPADNELMVSPIAEAMGIIGDEGWQDVEMTSNPIARQIWLGDESGNFSNEDGEFDEEEESSDKPGEKAMRVVFFLLAAIAVAIALAHCSGKAFWL
ncbi:MAG: hypothetical protein VCA55_01165 [Verrucomicrobiales bacterium]